MDDSEILEGIKEQIAIIIYKSKFRTQEEYDNNPWETVAEAAKAIYLQVAGLILSITSESGRYAVRVVDLEPNIQGLARFDLDRDEWLVSLYTDDKEEYKLLCPNCKKELDITDIIINLRKGFARIVGG